MLRPGFAISTLLILSLALAGCSSFMTKRTIEAFAESLETKDLDGLKQTASTDFEQRALRRPEAIDDLKFLKVPTGKVKVLEIEDVDSVTKMVKVAIGEKDKAKELEYRLTLDTTTRKWHVDDLVMSQQTSSRGDIVQQELSRQMDLLLTSREFLEAWSGTDRKVILEVCTTELQDTLDALPESWLTQTVHHVATSTRKRSFRPEARINGDRAVVVLPHADGKLFIELSLVDQQWYVSDAAIEPKTKSEEGVRSVAKMCKSLILSHDFLEAYAKSDREALSSLANKSFYDRCLSAADLTTQPLPVEALLSQPYEVRQFKDRTEVLLKEAGETFMLTLKSPSEDELAADESSDSLRVAEVTMFSGEGTQVRKLSAVFLSRAVIQLFSEAYATRDLDRLAKITSIDFNQRVIEKASPPLFEVMPLPEIAAVPPQILSTSFSGDVTEVLVTQGDQALNYVLHLSRGWMVVDDVQMPAENRPTSLKTNLELLMPLYAFTSAAHRNDIGRLMTHSAEGLDRIVWMQLDRIPDFGFDVPRHLMQPVSAVKPGDPWTTVRTGSDEYGAEVRLVKEGDRYVVHDVVLIDAQGPVARTELLRSLRQVIAQNLRDRAGATPVAGELTNPVPTAAPGGVGHASYEVVE